MIISVMIVTLSEKGEDMLSIARRTAAGAAILLIMPWPRGFRLDVAARAECHVAENVVLDNGNGHPAVGIITHVSLRLVSVVPALSSARGADVLRSSGALSLSVRA
jgi:hypothetical protein